MTKKIILDFNIAVVDENDKCYAFEIIREQSSYFDKLGKTEFVKKCNEDYVNELATQIFQIREMEKLQYDKYCVFERN